MSHIKLFTPSKGEKHWLIAHQDTLCGWIPHLESYFQVCTNKTPTTSDLAKLKESCPFTGTLNLALTINNYLDHADSIGWSDSQLMLNLKLRLRGPNQMLRKLELSVSLRQALVPGWVTATVRVLLLVC